jgi:hypothetical protein
MKCVMRQKGKTDGRCTHIADLLLGAAALWMVAALPTFRSNLLSPSSGYNTNHTEGKLLSIWVRTMNGRANGGRCPWGRVCGVGLVGFWFHMWLVLIAQLFSQAVYGCLSPLVSALVFLYKELQMEHLRSLTECCSDNQAQGLREQSWTKWI